MKIPFGMKYGLAAFLLSLSAFSCAKLKTTAGDFIFEFSGKYRPEMFFGKNIELLNNNNIGNKIWYARHTIDLKLGILYGQETFGKKVAEFGFDLRNKGTWGNPGSIAATTNATTKVTDSVARSHNHSIPLHIFWMRAGWLKFELSEILGLPFDNEHWFTVGIFPYSLGRGISLGDAYRVGGPSLLGFYSESIVDQYAPGGLLHSQIVDTLSFDLYGAILRNRSTSLRETNEAVYAQVYGRRDTPQRGSGKIDFLIASRMQWRPLKGEDIGDLVVEPYVLYNRDPEQTVEIFGDATSQLGTAGLALEYNNSSFGIGFDSAINLGQQRVKGLDRNAVTEANNQGQVVIINSHVVDQNGKKIPFVRGSQGQDIINCAPQNEAFNGKEIGTVASGVGYLAGPTTISNSSTRFRNPYTNQYRGWMFVIDASYFMLDRQLAWSVATGVASGDENPNDETIDGTYDGFIPLQSIYAGKRVESVFLLGGAGGLRRPLSDPETIQSSSRFAKGVDGFTNIVYAGTSLLYKPNDWSREFSMQPNVIAFWQEKATRRFDAETKKQLDKLASTFLGVELNMLMDCMVLKDLKLFAVGSVFFPGTHYKEIKGKPLDAAQQALLDALDSTGFDQTRIPNIGDNAAYTFNVGMEFKF